MLKMKQVSIGKNCFLKKAKAFRKVDENSGV